MLLIVIDVQRNYYNVQTFTALKQIVYTTRSTCQFAVFIATAVHSRYYIIQRVPGKEQSIPEKIITVWFGVVK